MINFPNIFSYKQKLLLPAQLKRLNEHKYSYTSISLLDPFLQPWWNFLVSFVPLWLAPNLITIIGLIVNIITTLILIFYSSDGREYSPRWASALCGFGLFVYQSLDAIDGKQARRTNSSTPLGELFDHGCDAVSTVFVALSACVGVRLGFYPKWLFFQCFCAMTLFYCAHWQTYVSGSLRFGKIDVTEAQCTIMIIHFITAIFGPEIWMAPMPVLGTWNLIVCGIFLIGYFQVFISFLKIFIVGGGVGKNGSTVAGTSVLSPMLPILMVIIPAYIMAEKSEDSIFEKYPSLYVLTFGMVATKITIKLVVAHMTRSEMDKTDCSFWGPGLLFLNQYFSNFLSEYFVLWVALVWCTFDLVRYCKQICYEICDHLNIDLFKIPYPPKQPQTNTGFLNSAHDRNGSNLSSQSVNSKRQTRSNKRNIQ